MFVVADLSGMVGRLVAETLLEQGHRVRVLVRDASKREAWLQRGARVTVHSDDESELAHNVDGARGVFVRLPESARASPLYRQRRAMVHRIAAAMKARVPHIVLLSTALAGADVGRDRAGRGDAEKALRATGSVVTTLRTSHAQENAFPIARVIAMLAVRRLLSPPERSVEIDFVGPMVSLRRFAHKLDAERGVELRLLDVSTARRSDGSAWS